MSEIKTSIMNCVMDDMKVEDKFGNYIMKHARTFFVQRSYGWGTYFNTFDEAYTEFKASCDSDLKRPTIGE